MPFSNESEIVQMLSASRRPRATIYLNQKRVDEYYSQRLGPITDLSRSGKLSGDVGMSVFNILKADISSERGLSGGGSLTPVLKAMLIETEAKVNDQLADLAVDHAPGALVATFSGDGRIFDTEDPVSGDLLLSAQMAEVIQNERMRQQKVLRGSTIVWVGLPGGAPLASICHDGDNVYRSFLASYPNAPFGILGYRERELHTVLFIAPLWIWHEL